MAYYDKLDDFNFDIINFPFIDGEVPLFPSFGAYIWQLNHLERVCSNISDYNNRNQCLTVKILQQG